MTLPDVMQMGTEDLDALLPAIALERVKRQPQVAMEQPKTMEAALDPRWHISMAEANTVLQLRHPGYGWVGYAIPPARTDRARAPLRAGPGARLSLRIDLRTRSHPCC